MANWKKVIVSGSNAHLNHITASGDISASGFLFGNLPSGDHDEVVIYNTTTGRLEFKVLNLVNTERASRLALFERNTSNQDANNVNFRLSYDTGSVITGVAPVILVSSSNDGGSTFNNSSLVYKGINDEFAESFPNEVSEVFYNLSVPTNTTGSIADVRESVDSGQTSLLPVNINFQSVQDNNTGFPAYFDGVNLNFGARAFDRGGIGELRLFINTMDPENPTTTIPLTDYDAITTDNSSVTMDLFATASNVGDGGAPDPTKHYRSGSFTIKTAAQTDGFNYAFAIHTGSEDGTEFSYITNVFQWFYDIEGAGLEMDFENQGVISNPTFDATDTASISGIKFYSSTAADNTSFKYGIKAINQYRNIYPVNGGIQVDGVTTNTIDRIEITQSGQYIDTSDSNVKQLDTSISANDNTFNLVDLIANNANAHTNDTEITASFGITFNNLTGDFLQPTSFLDGFTTDNIENSANEIGFTFQLNSVSGHKNTTSSDAVTLGDYMVNTLSSNRNEYEFEDFRTEEYRIQSKSYDENDNPAEAAHEWDGEKNIVNGGDGFNKGAIQYYSHLLYPTGAGVGGTFNPSFGPDEADGQPSNYDTATGEREYYRYFHVVNTPINQTGNKSVNLEIVGSGKVVADDHTTHFGNGDNDAVKIFVMRNEGNSFSNFNGKFVNIVSSSIRDQGTLFNNTQTQWIPMASSTSNIAYGDTTVSVGGITVPRGVVKFGETEASANTIQLDEELIIKIVMPENFTGYIDAILLNYGIQPTSRMNSQYSSAI